MKKHVITTEHNLICEVCDNEFTSKYRNSLYCCNACKQKAYREGITTQRNAQNQIELQLIQEKNIAKEHELEEKRLDKEKEQLDIEKIKRNAELLREENIKKAREEKKEKEREMQLARYEQQQKVQNQITQQAIEGILQKIFK